MKSDFMKDLEIREGIYEKDLSVIRKEKDFYNKLENSFLGKSTKKIQGGIETGFHVCGNAFSYVNDFDITFESSQYHESFRGTDVKKVGVVKFFNDSKFGEFKMNYHLEDKKMSEDNMNILYALNVDDNDYSGTPLMASSPYFVFPNKISEISDFYLGRGMSKDLVLRLVGEIEVVRRSLK